MKPHRDLPLPALGAPTWERDGARRSGRRGARTDRQTAEATARTERRAREAAGRAKAARNRREQACASRRRPSILRRRLPPGPRAGWAGSRPVPAPAPALHGRRRGGRAGRVWSLGLWGLRAHAPRVHGHRAVGGAGAGRTAQRGGLLHGGPAPGRPARRPLAGRQLHVGRAGAGRPRGGLPLRPQVPLDVPGPAAQLPPDRCLLPARLLPPGPHQHVPGTGQRPAEDLPGRGRGEAVGGALGLWAAVQGDTEGLLGAFVPAPTP